MYVSNKDGLKADGKTYNSGEVIPSASSWDVCALRANLNLEWIKEVPDEANDCPKCEKKGFKTSRALKAHITRFHK